LKIKVNDNIYDVELMGREIVRVNGREIVSKFHDDNITIEGKKFHLDFEEEGEPSLMIINGMAYLVSRSSRSEKIPTEVRAPISGRVIDLFVTEGSKVEKGQVMIILEAMKMENEIKSPASRWIKEIGVHKGQSVKMGDVLVSFDSVKS
jgi:biotin carboxyl carrier protein